MSDDLFSNCDCGDCGDCDFDCDCDCCDCDFSCDDCFPENNVIVICCCFPPESNKNQSNKTNRGSTSPDCFCCCKRRKRRESWKKKKGFCCWRLWCCFRRNDPSPPPSPPRPRPDELSSRGHYKRDGRYPMNDHDLYRGDRWARHDEELDMPPRGYMSGGRYPMHADVGMYRDELCGRGAKWDDPRGMRRDYRRRDDRGDVRGMPLRDRQRNNEEYARRVELDSPPKVSHGSRQDKPDELVVRPEDYQKYRYQGDSEIAQQGHQFESKWSRPVKYEENAAQTRD